MNIISIQDVLECNSLLKEKGLPFKIHLRDACGKQSCSIESGGEAGEDARRELYGLLEDYFGKKRFTLLYSDDRDGFWLMN